MTDVRLYTGEAEEAEVLLPSARAPRQLVQAPGHSPLATLVLPTLVLPTLVLATLGLLTCRQLACRQLTCQTQLVRRVKRAACC